MNVKRLLTLSAMGLAGLLWIGNFSDNSGGTKTVAASQRSTAMGVGVQGPVLPAVGTAQATALEPAPPLTADVADLVAKIQNALASFSIEQLEVALSQLLPTLLEKDPAAAAQLAESILEPNLRAELIHLVARAWGAKNPRSALTWAGNLKTEYEREAALTEAGAHLALTDPAQALAWTAPAFRANEPSAALETLAQRWAEINLAETLQWVREHSGGAQRDGLLARLALVEAKISPVAAARLVAEEMNAGELQDEAALSVVHQWARRDPGAAFAWAGRFPSRRLRERALTELEVVAKFSPASQSRPSPGP